MVGGLELGRASGLEEDMMGVKIEGRRGHGGAEDDGEIHGLGLWGEVKLDAPLLRCQWERGKPVGIGNAMMLFGESGKEAKWLAPDSHIGAMKNL
jgi:hypothetical protein